ncbi:CRISPR system precrRNA processing endoribonuclease RAMP protein Cas6 [Marichromatium sp. PS1]|uniref:CRISPR system precrRNA processing endoribonuclease RAMP protein Cas6 n=1 Tax=Marichromatium sp. PS1 TaxID=3138932 RepID=UPI0034E8A808
MGYGVEIVYIRDTECVVEMDILSPMSSLAFPALMRLRFCLRALDTIQLPAYAGSTWRGLLGHGLRGSVCVTGAPSCDGCLLSGTCVYSTLFEIPAGAPANTPHPFLLELDPEAPSRLVPGEEYALGITLVGSAITQAPYLIHALTQAGEQGAGASRGRFSLVRVEAEPRLGSDVWTTLHVPGRMPYQAPSVGEPDPPPAPLGTDVLRLHLLTPLRIKRAGRLVGAREFVVDDLLKALQRRLHALAITHDVDLGHHIAHYPQPGPATVRLSASRLRWFDWTRYSSRQHRQMQFGGLLGELELEGEGLETLWPSLWLGQWTHLGKASAFGLGAYGVMTGVVKSF